MITRKGNQTSTKQKQFFPSGFAVRLAAMHILLQVIRTVFVNANSKLTVGYFIECQLAGICQRLAAVPI